MKYLRRNVEFVRQSESSECGLACINMIAKYHGYHITLSELRKNFPISSRGMNLSRLIEISDLIKMRARAVRLSHSEISKLSLPCILHWDFNHFVVLSEVRRGGVKILDPARGELLVSHRELDDRFTGVAVEFSLISGFVARKEEKKASVTTYFKEIFGLKKAAVTLASIAFALEFITLINPLYVQIVLDRIIGTGEITLLLPLSIVFFLILLMQFVLAICRSWLIINMGSKINVSWLDGLYSHLIRLPYSWFEVHSKADVVSRFNSIRSIQSGLAATILASFFDGLIGLITVLILFLYSTSLAFLVLGFFVVYLVIKIVFLPKLRRATTEVVLNQTWQQHELIESLGALLAIKINNKQFFREAKFRCVVGHSSNAEISIQRLIACSTAASQWTMATMRIFAIAGGAYLVSSHHMSAGMLISFLVYADLFVSRSFSFMDKFYDIKLLQFHFDRIQEVMRTETERLDHETSTSFFTLGSSDLECRDLWFKYPGTEGWILKNLNFKVSGGESVVIVGPSGCGKSTLAKLILGLLSPSQGTISVDGVLPSAMGLANFRNLFGTVMQEDRLLSGSIFDNISFFDSLASFDLVQSAAKLAAIDGEILRMPMGYHTIIGDMGSSLSGGQIQRILLARALYREPKILILDEATSHLNVELEEVVSANIKGLNITRVIIAHRPETINSADRVISLGD